MNLELQVFLFGVLVFIVFSIGFLVIYAPAAGEESEHERTALARFTLWVLKVLRFWPPEEGVKGSP